MPLFGERVSMLEIQNRALIKTARERAERIEQLEHALQSDSAGHRKRHPSSRKNKKAESTSRGSNESCSN
jgi:hypothetical protein